MNRIQENRVVVNEQIKGKKNNYSTVHTTHYNLIDFGTGSLGFFFLQIHLGFPLLSRAAW